MEAVAFCFCRCVHDGKGHRKVGKDSHVVSLVCRSPSASPYGTALFLSELTRSSQPVESANAECGTREGGTDGAVGAEDTNSGMMMHLE